MRKRDVVTDAAVGSLAGIAAGLIAGIGARLAMRMVADGVADGVGVRPTFTVEGTAAILISGSIIGAPIGVIYGALLRRIPGPESWRALIFSVAVLAVLGPFFFLGNEEFFSSGRVLLFAALFPAYGITVGFALAPSRQIVVGLPMALRGAIASVGLLGGALLTFGLLGRALQSTGVVPM